MQSVINNLKRNLNADKTLVSQEIIAMVRDIDTECFPSYLD
jgi:hypothetical protein